jgi:hypothetical protein
LQITGDSSFNCSVLFIDKGINPLVAFIRKSILFEYKQLLCFRAVEKVILLLFQIWYRKSRQLSKYQCVCVLFHTFEPLHGCKGNVFFVLNHDFSRLSGCSGFNPEHPEKS